MTKVGLFFSRHASGSVWVVMCFLFHSVTAQAQADASNDKPGDARLESGQPLENSENKTDADTSVSKDNTSQSRSLDLELEALKQRVQKLEEKSADDDAKIADMQTQLDFQDEAEVVRMEEKERALKVYGFLDVQFSKLFFRDDSLLDGLLPHATSFALGHWNIFLEKPLSEHFRVLGEVRFLFQPLGEEANGWMGSGDFERVNTNATDWVDAYYFNWGGIAIQRAYVEFKLNDHFGVRAGHYLTPYGVWNEDHASTVVISAHRPYLNTAKYLPEAQTGLYFFGRAFAGPKVCFDYGFTVSNGRGPATEVYDLDENKGLGLVLKMKVDGPVKLDMGTYLYMGDYTDLTRSLTYENGIDFVENITVEYKEKAFSVHLKLEWAGIYLQGEYVRELIEYQNDHRPLAEYALGTSYAPDHVRQGAYALLGYMLPFEKVQIRPYFFYEYMGPPRWSGLPFGHAYGGGINWRIVPPVVWKLEYYYLNNDDVDYLANTDLSVVMTQLAVSY